MAIRNVVPMNPEISIIGHRGATGLFPEQTIAGFAKALELGVDGLEMDLAITADRKVVAYHDAALNPVITRDSDRMWLDDRVCKISELTLEQLKTYDIGRIKPGSEYANRFPDQKPVDGSRIPTLEEIVDLDRKFGRNPTYFIEIKYYAVAPYSSIPVAEGVETIVAEIERLGISSTVRIHSFDWKLVHAFRSFAPHLQYAYLTSQTEDFNTMSARTELREVCDDSANPTQTRSWTDGMLLSDFDGSLPQMIKSAGGTDWHADHASVTTDRIAEAHCLGIRVYAWTVNQASDFERLVDAQIDGIITDYPDRLIAFLGR
ncbi:MAG: glycerophosphodiester phosphodiesterase family protein [Acidiferrobacterales bacterium]|nr:glycerophosphodiester phosphodiesterase family protein [Acidiferrobacterales bacterium]